MPAAKREKESRVIRIMVANFFICSLLLVVVVLEYYVICKKKSREKIV